MDLQVREATHADRGTLVRFHMGLYESHRNEVVDPEILPLLDYRDYARVLEEDVDALLAGGNNHILIAELAGVAVGYITGRTTVEPRRVLPSRGTVEDWYVDPVHRNQGIGSALLTKIEERFRLAGCQVVESATWTSNKGARKKHDAMGFREIRVIYRKRL